MDDGIFTVKKERAATNPLVNFLDFLEVYDPKFLTNLYNSREEYKEQRKNLTEIETPVGAASRVELEIAKKCILNANDNNPDGLLNDRDYVSDHVADMIDAGKIKKESWMARWICACVMNIFDVDDEDAENVNANLCAINHDSPAYPFQFYANRINAEDVIFESPKEKDRIINRLYKRLEDKICSLYNGERVISGNDDVIAYLTTSILSSQLTPRDDVAGGFISNSFPAVTASLFADLNINVGLYGKKDSKKILNLAKEAVENTMTSLVINEVILNMPTKSRANVYVQDREYLKDDLMRPGIAARRISDDTLLMTAAFSVAIAIMKYYMLYDNDKKTDEDDIVITTSTPVKESEAAQKIRDLTKEVRQLRRDKEDLQRYADRQTKLAENAKNKQATGNTAKDLEISQLKKKLEEVRDDYADLSSKYDKAIFENQVRLEEEDNIIEELDDEEDIDVKNMRILFICGHDPCRQLLLKYFPNSVSSDKYDLKKINADKVDLVVCITSCVAHAEVYKVKSASKRTGTEWMYTPYVSPVSVEKHIATFLKKKNKTKRNQTEEEAN